MGEYVQQKQDLYNVAFHANNLSHTSLRPDQDQHEIANQVLENQKAHQQVPESRVPPLLQEMHAYYYYEYYILLDLQTIGNLQPKTFAQYQHNQLNDVVLCLVLPS